MIIDGVNLARAQGHCCTAHDLRRPPIVAKLRGVVDRNEDLLTIVVAVIADTAPW